MKALPQMNWWWRDVIKRLPKRPLYKQSRWTEIEEVPAFRWELVRRLFPLNEYPAYTELTRAEIEIVRPILQHGRWPAVIEYRDARPPHPGYAVFAHTAWNLRASPETLRREFLAHIEAARKHAGIATPRRNKDNYHRGVSWNQVELMETRTGLTDTQRSHLSQARKKAQQLKGKFLQAWSEIQAARRSFACDCKHEIPFTHDPKLLAVFNEPMNWQEWL